MNPKDRLIIPLDVPSVGDAEAMVEKLGDAVSFYKIGHQLAFAGGLDFAKTLISDGKQVFLDMKLLDIDNTIEKGIENIVKMGVQMTTIHAYPKAMHAAVKAASGSDLCLLGVTVLTSMDDGDVYDAGYSLSAEKLVEKRAAQARDAGMGGIVCSPKESSIVRGIIGPNLAIVTPGIRPTGSDVGDQKRIMSPADAISAGSSHLVVGRPVTASQDPRASALAITEQIAKAL